MFTRNRVIMSHNIKTPLTSISRAVGNILQLKDDQLIKSLFANNEQGFFYDPNDLSTMFQDSTGTTPVTAVGQPVGLMLDKSKGLVLGSELASVTEVVSLPIDGVVGVKAYPIGTLAIGKTYQISFTVTNYTGSGDVGIAGPTTQWADGTTVNTASNGTKRCIRTKLTTREVYLYTRNTAACVFSNISIKELAGNHAYQTTSASRPILRKNAVTGANYLEFDGVDDFLITGSFPAMGLGTTIFSGSLCNKSTTSAIVARGVGGYIYQTSSSTQVQSVNNTIVIPINGNTVATTLYDPSGTGVTLQANSQTTTNPIIERGYNVSNPLIIGAFNSSGGSPFRGNIYSLIGINRVATTPEITNIRNAIAKKVGVTL